jgi:hypothetical protein
MAEKVLSGSRLGGLIAPYEFLVAILPGAAPAPAPHTPGRERFDRQRNRPAED